MNPVLLFVSSTLCVIMGLIALSLLVSGLKTLLQIRAQKSLWNNGVSPFSGKKWIREAGPVFRSDKSRVYYDGSGNRLTVSHSSVDGIHIN